MTIELIRELYDYHRWANRRLFDVAAALGDEVAGRAIGTQFSSPMLRGMFAHLYSTDWFYLQAWQRQPSTPAPGEGAQTLAELRRWWDDVESEQRRFIDALDEPRIARVIDTSTGKTLGMLLVHVPNHATHHRSEIATMLTMVSGSPPDTGINSYYRAKTDQRTA
jgi:uncharacterized damage-inducible protein DinB